jgi:hypothetical protein
MWRRLQLAAGAFARATGNKPQRRLRLAAGALSRAGNWALDIVGIVGSGCSLVGP